MAQIKNDLDAYTSVMSKKKKNNSMATVKANYGKTTTTPKTTTTKTTNPKTSTGVNKTTDKTSTTSTNKTSTTKTNTIKTNTTPTRKVEQTSSALTPSKDKDYIKSVVETEYNIKKDRGQEYQPNYKETNPELYAVLNTYGWDANKGDVYLKSDKNYLESYYNQLTNKDYQAGLVNSEDKDYLEQQKTYNQNVANMVRQDDSLSYDEKQRYLKTTEWNNQNFADEGISNVGIEGKAEEVFDENGNAIDYDAKIAEIDAQIKAKQQASENNQTTTINMYRQEPTTKKENTTPAGQVSANMYSQSSNINKEEQTKDVQSNGTVSANMYSQTSVSTPTETDKEIEELKKQREELVKKQTYQNKVYGSFQTTQMIESGDTENASLNAYINGGKDDSTSERILKAVQSGAGQHIVGAVDTVNAAIDFYTNAKNDLILKYADNQERLGNTETAEEIRKAIVGYDMLEDKHIGTQLTKNQQAIIQSALNNASSGQKIAVQTANTIADQLARRMYGGTSEVGEVIGLTLAGASTFSSSYRENLQKGWSRETALANATLKTGATVMTEKMSWEGMNKVFSSSIGNYFVGQQISGTEAFMAYAKDRVKAGVEEGLEEVLEDGWHAKIDQITNMITGDEDVDAKNIISLIANPFVEDVTPESMMESFAMAFLSTEIQGLGGDVLGGGLNNNPYNFYTQDKQTQVQEYLRNSSFEVKDKKSYNATIEAMDTIQRIANDTTADDESRQFASDYYNFLERGANAFSQKSQVSMGVELESDDVAPAPTPLEMYDAVRNATMPSIDDYAQQEGQTQAEIKIGNDTYNSVDEVLKQNSINLTVEQYQSLDEQRKQDLWVISNFAKNTGLDVSMVNGGLTDTNGKTVVGQFDPSTNKIMLDANASNEAKLISTMVHETTHFNENSLRYLMLRDNVIENVGKDKFGQLVSGYLAKFGGTEENAISEVVAMESETLLGNQEFLTQLALYNSNEAYSLYEDLKSMMDETGTENSIVHSFEQAFVEAQRYKDEIRDDLKETQYSEGGKVAVDNMLKSNDPKVVERAVELNRNRKLAEKMYNTKYDDGTRMYTDQEIWKETHWVRKDDGKWRFQFFDGALETQNEFLDKVKEVKDIISKAKKNGSTNRSFDLSEIIYDKTFFEMYPMLKNLEVNIDQQSDDDSAGYYKPANKKDSDDVDYIKIYLSDKEGDEFDDLYLSDTLFHEIQHAIQDKEGFERGSSEEAIKEKVADKLVKALKGLQSLKNKMAKQGFDYDEMMNEYFNLLMTGRTSELNYEYEPFIEDAKKYQNEIEKYKGFDRGKIFQTYYGTLGEIEARESASKMLYYIRNDGSLEGYDTMPTTKGIVKDRFSHNLTEEDLLKYNEAVENNDTKTEREVLDKVAKENGFSEKWYHGSIDASFTSYDVEKSKYNIGIWLSDKGTAMGYANTSSIPIKTNLLTNQKITNVEDAIYELNRKGWNIVKKDGTYYRRVFGIEQSLDVGNDNDLIKLAERHREKGGVYSLYVNPGKKLVIEGNNRNWDDIQSKYGKTTDDIAQKAKALGYDSVEFRDIYDGQIQRPYPNNVLVCFNPEQVKSTDPVTYDDEGNVVPLSQRFNSESRDLRNSHNISEEDLLNGYHYGSENIDYNKKSERLSQRGGRSTGAFGTGFYFFGKNGNNIESFSKGKTEHKINTNGYNLFKPNNAEDGFTIHDFFKKLDDMYSYENVLTEEELDSKLEQFEDDVVELENNPKTLSKVVEDLNNTIGKYQTSKLLNDAYEQPSGWYMIQNDGTTYDENTNKQVPASEVLKHINVEKFANVLYKFINSRDTDYLYRRAYDTRAISNSINKVASILGVDAETLSNVVNSAMESARADSNKQDFLDTNYDSVGTRVMKQLGYEGIDVRGIKGLDNSTYGSVIYDLKPESVQYSHNLTEEDLLKGLENEEASGEKYGTYEPNPNSKGINVATKVDIINKRTGKPVVDENGNNKTAKVSEATENVVNSWHVRDESSKEFLARTSYGEFIRPNKSFEKAYEEARAYIKENGLWKALNYSMSADSIERGFRDTAMRIMLLDELDNRGYANNKQYQELMERGAVVASFIGQDLVAQKMFNTMPIQSQISTLRNEVDLYEKFLNQRRLTKKTNLTLNEKLVEEYEDANTTNKRRLELRKEIAKDIASQIKASLYEKWYAWRYLSMLGNPKTWGKNFISNYVFGGISQANRALRSALESAFIKNAQTKDKDSKTYKRFANMERQAGTYNSFNKEQKETYKKAKDYFYEHYKNQERKYTPIDVGSLLSSTSFAKEIQKYREVWGDNVVGKLLKAYQTAVNWGLSDSPAMSKSYGRAMVGYLKVNNLTWDTMSRQQFAQADEYAYQEALKDTFNQANEISKKIIEFTRGKGKSKINIGKIATDAIMPFKRTPLNIAKTALKYSPFGLGYTAITGLKQIDSGRITANEYIDNLSSGITGTGLAGLGALLASLGIFRTRDDDKDRKQYFDEDNGEQNYAIVTPWGTYTVDFLDPTIMPIAFGAEVYNAISDVSEGKDVDVVDVFGSLIEPLFETTMLEDLTSIFDSYKEGGAKAIDILAQMLTNYLGQHIPSVNGAIARTIDDTRRTTYPNDGVFDKFFKKLANKNIGVAVANQVNKAKGNDKVINQPYINLKGEEEKNEDLGLGAFGRAFLNFVSPGYWSSADNSEYVQESNRLYESTGEGSALPSSSKKEFTYDSEKYDFTDEEYTQFAKTRWSTEYELVNEFMNSDEYKEMDDTERVVMMDALRSYAGDLAKAEILEGRGVDISDSDLSNSIEKYQNAEEQGISPVEYTDFKKSTSNKGDKIEYIYESDLDEEQKKYLYDTEVGTYYKNTDYQSAYEKYITNKEKEDEGDTKETTEDTTKTTKTTSSKSTSSRNKSVGSLNIGSSDSVKQVNPSGSVKTVKGGSTYMQSNKSTSSKNGLTEYFTNSYGTLSKDSKTTCSHCGATVPKGTTTCPVCGKRV